VAHDGDAFGVDDTEGCGVVDGGSGTGDELFDVGIVGLGGAFTDDGDAGVLYDA
jgi:hypothetical protein